MILAPDAEIVALAALRGALPGVAAGTITPASRAEPFVRLRRIGGTMTGRVVDEALLDVLVHGPDDHTVMTLARQARAALLALRGTKVAGVIVYAVSESTGPARLPDPGDPDKSLVLFTLFFSIRASEAS